MNELIEVKKRSFDEANARLKVFSEQSKKNYKIDMVNTGGGFLDLFDHKVTGDELNKRLKTIQSFFIASNNQINDIITEFREIYNTFDVLDKDYIASIVSFIKAIEKTSNDVGLQQESINIHQEKILSHQDSLEIQHDKIKGNIKNITKIVECIKRFNEKLNSYSHLSDIDEIWSDCEDIKVRMHELSSEVKKCMKDISTFESEIQNFEGNIIILKEHIDSTSQQLNEQIENIQELIVYKTKLESIDHLSDIDESWQTLQEHSNALVAIKEKEKVLDLYIKNYEKEINTKLLGFIQTNEMHVEQLTKQLSKAYWIGVGALSLSIIEFIIIFMR